MYRRHRLVAVHRHPAPWDAFHNPRPAQPVSGTSQTRDGQAAAEVCGSPAAQLPESGCGDSFDRMLAAQTELEGMDLVTRDPSFKLFHTRVF